MPLEISWYSNIFLISFSPQSMSLAIYDSSILANSNMSSKNLLLLELNKYNSGTSINSPFNFYIILWILEYINC